MACGQNTRTRIVSHEPFAATVAAFRSLRAALIGLFLSAAPGLAAPDCTLSDIGDALESGYDSAQELLRSPSCAPHYSNTGFWVVSAAVTAAVVSSQEMRDVCDGIVLFNVKIGETEAEWKERFEKLPPQVKDKLREIFQNIDNAANLTEMYKELGEALSFVTCACAVAQSTGVAAVLSVAGECMRDLLCELQELITGEGCAGAPKVWT